MSRRFEYVNNNWILKHMPRPKKEAGSLTGSKRVKSQTKSKASAKAKQAAQKAADLIGDLAKTVTKTPETTSKSSQATVLNKASNGGLVPTNNGNNGTIMQDTSKSAIESFPESLKDSPLSPQNFTAKGFEGGFNEIQRTSDPYMGVKLPEFDANGAIPQDPLKPDGIETMSEDDANKALAVYAGGVQVQRVRQAGYNYVGEVGKTVQAREKSKQSLIKGGREGVKTQQEIVKFDTERVNLETAIEGRNQAVQRLEQGQVKTEASVIETHQIRQKLGAAILKRDAEVSKLVGQATDIKNKYLQGVINTTATPVN